MPYPAAHHSLPLTCVTGTMVPPSTWRIGYLLDPTTTLIRIPSTVAHRGLEEGTLLACVGDNILRIGLYNSMYINTILNVVNRSNILPFVSSLLLKIMSNDVQIVYDKQNI